MWTKKLLMYEPSNIYDRYSKFVVFEQTRQKSRLTFDTHPFFQPNWLEHIAHFLIHGFCVLGHSLGAGLAVLLGILLRPRYPYLRVYAFATPGEYV